MSDLSYYLTQIIDGIAYGSIYGIFALSIVIIYRANKLFNFAQTEMATLCIIGMVFLLKSYSFWPSLIITLGAAFTFGSLLHMSVMRFVTEKKKSLVSSEVIVTIGLLIIFNNISSYILGDEAQAFPSPFSSDAIKIFGLAVSFQSLIILLAAAVMIFAIYLCFKLTRLGLKFEAVAENVTAARLRGIRASDTLALAWGLTTLFSTLGAVLIAPILFVTPSMLGNIFAYSLIAMVIGGLESPLGAVVGGIIIGVVENLASSTEFIGTELKFIVVFLILIVMLVIRPRGLWGREEARRV